MHRNCPLSLLLISACSGHGANGRSVDLNAAAARAESDIANYAARSRGNEAAPAHTGVITADYACRDGNRFVARFDNRAATATLIGAGSGPIILAERRTASGMRYSGSGYTLRDKGRMATLITPSGASYVCRGRS